MKHIILASASPRRKAILEQVGLDFEIIPSNYEEDMTLDLPPLELAKHLASNKAKDVAQSHSDSVVIGADTFVVFKNQLIGKPHTVEKAREVLTMLSGQTHEIITGVSVIEGDKEVTDVVSTKVTFRKLSPEEIDVYIQKDDPLENAGSYKIQEKGALLVEKIEGDYLNIVGLSVVRLSGMLKQFGINLI